MSVQLDALADEVFEAAAALDLVSPSGPRTVAAPIPGGAGAGYTGEARVAMVQVFPQIPSRSVGGQGGGLTIRPVENAERWVTFEGLIRADIAEQGGTEEMTADLVTLYRWRAANTPQRFYLAYGGERALAHVGLFQHRSSAYLYALFTHPDFRRRGVGSFLTLAMDSEARAAGCERVVLQCTRDSHLLAYFERLGFRAVAEQQIWTKPK